MTPCESPKPEVSPPVSNCAPSLDMNQMPQNNSNSFSTNQFHFANAYVPNPSPNIPPFADSDSLPFGFQVHRTPYMYLSQCMYAENINAQSTQTPSFPGLHSQPQQYYNHSNSNFSCTQTCCNDRGFAQYNMHPFGPSNSAHFPPYFPQNNHSSNNSNNFFYDANIAMQQPTQNRHVGASVICHAPGRARYGSMNCITSSDLAQKKPDNAVDDDDGYRLYTIFAYTPKPPSNKDQYVYNSNGDVIGVLESMNIVAVNGQFNIMRPVKNNERKVKIKQNKKEQPKKKNNAGNKKMIKTITRSTMKKGRHISAAEKLFVCKECGKGYKYLCNFRSHCKIHTDDAFVCSYCGKRFGRKSNYKEHVRIHTGEAPYKCKYCDRTFKQHHGWKDHMRVHTGEKPYQCSICKKRFTVGHNLNVHMRIHTGERPYSCKKCDKTFRQKSAYNSHQKQVHGLKVQRSSDKTLLVD